MASLQDINTNFTKAATQFGGTAADFAKTPQFADFHGQLNGYYSGLNDPNEISSQLLYQQGRVNDPIYGDSARALVTTLQSRQAAVNPSSSSSNTAMPGIVPVQNPFPRSGVISQNQGQETSGGYTPQNQSVEARLPGLLSTDNPLVQTAVANTTLDAQKRGLQNSTMAVQAGQQAAQAAVLPIASQDAAQIAGQNLSAQGASQSGALQGQQIQGTLTGTAMSIDAQKQQLATQIAAQNEQLAKSLGSQANLQAAQIAANKQLQGEQLTAQEKMLADQLKSAMDQLNVSTTSQQGISAATLKQQAQQQAATMASQFAGIYQDAINQINNNKDMPAESRTAALQGAAKQYDSNMTLLKQLFSVELTWTTTVPASGTVPTPQVNL